MDNIYNAKIIDSDVEATSICYNNVRVSHSKIGQRCNIGDNSILFKSKMEGFNVINRNNFISDSEFGLGTYTGMNCIIKDTTIGRFCDLSWNLSIGGGKPSLY